MGCRCNDISKLNKEIMNLNYALSQIGYAENSSINTISKMREVADIFESGVILGNKHNEIAEDIRKKYDKAVEYINSAKNGVSDTLRHAQNELDSAKSEDRRYHEASRKK